VTVTFEEFSPMHDSFDYTRSKLFIQPRPGHLSLTRDSGEFMVLHKDEVEIGKSG